MTTYSGNTNSKSVNARQAERDGRFPATAMAARLREKGLFRGVTAADIKAAVRTGEWHHVGSYAARVDYYGLGDIYEHRAALRAQIAGRRVAPKPEGTRYEGCAVEWLEWSGTRNHPRADEQRAEGVAVTVKGKFATIHLPGRDVRKQLSARGFVLRRADGSRVI